MYSDMGKIIYNIIANPRRTKRELASSLNMSSQDLNYKLNRIKDENIIQRYMVHVNPLFIGEKSLYLAYENSTPPPVNPDISIKCLEKINVYGYIGNDEKLKELKNRMDNLYGEPVMVYSPASNDPGIKRTAMDDLIINKLRENPLASGADLSKALDVSYKKVNRRLDMLLKSRAVNIIPKVDMSKLNIFFLGIFSSKMDKIKEKYGNYVIQVDGSERGFGITIEPDIISARKKVEVIRSIDKDTDVMIIYDYEFNS